MTSHSYRLVALFVISAATVAALAGAPASDLPSPEVRRHTVELAKRLSEPGTPPALPAELVNPFDPPAFGQPDPEELAAIAAAQAAQAAANAASVKSKPSNDGDLLKILAQRVSPSGTMRLGNDSLLIFGSKRLRVGDTLSVTYDGTEYKVQIAAIDAITFTLRLNRAEITRRIN